ncbi:MAG TPA: SRPBCC family protein [Acidobacteriaceae bacterium]|nr:SRPBCC family protein [Acidobacteriaceae bacterium]
MPEHVSRLDSALPEFPAAEGRGAIFSPLAQDTHEHRMRAHTVQTIGVDAQTLYELWKNVALAPRWMEYVVSAEPKSAKLTHWVLGNPEEPNGRRLEYDTEIVEEIPGEKISWRSIDSSVKEAGEVLFRPAMGDRGTVVVLQESANIPGGSLGMAAAAVAKRSPRQIVIEDLRHFKQLAEAGEIPTVDRNPHGPRGFIGSLKEHLYGENNPTPPGTKVH